jgi:hypothetical protein
LLQRELGVEPEADTRALYREILPLSGSRTMNGAGAIHVAGDIEAPGPSPEGAFATPGQLASEIPSIGRGAELAALRPLVDATGSGNPLVLLGEAGVGKSRIVAELAADAARQGHGVRSMRMSVRPSGTGR